MAGLYFTRHAESLENAGIACIDPPLSSNGRGQAKALSGHFDIVICTPLRRTQETLHYSKITYEELLINTHFRERIFGEATALMFETKMSETDDEFFGRVKQFDDYIDNLRRIHPGKKILLIGHAYYFNCWTKKGCVPAPCNAVIHKLQ